MLAVDPPDIAPLIEVLAQAPPGQVLITPATAWLDAEQPVVIRWVGERTAVIEVDGEPERRLVARARLWVRPSTLTWAAGWKEPTWRDTAAIPRRSRA